MRGDRHHMISRLSGKIIRVSEGTASIDLGGICYEVLIPSHLHAILQDKQKIARGDDITFHTIHYIESSPAGGNQVPRLIGFLEETEKEFFEKYISVKGLGMKKALKSMIIPASKIATAVETEDTGGLRSLPEIGKRLATQIIAELKGKVAKFALMEKDKEAAAPVKLRRDPFILEALDILTEQLQYRRSEAEEMIGRALTKNPSLADTESLIKEIFMQQGKKSGIAFRSS